MADAHQLAQNSPNPKIAPFSPGDTIRVNFQVREGERVRVQSFEGIVIRRRGSGPGTTFTVRRTSYNIGVERTFPIFSPLIESVSVLQRGDVRRARLYYLRTRFGRKARVKTHRLPRGIVQAPEPLETEVPTPTPDATPGEDEGSEQQAPS